MGVAPLNKLYSMMLTVYSFTKQAEARAYSQTLQAKGIASSTTNLLLLLFAGASFVFGPCIGFFDVYYDVKTHCKVTQIFTIGEIGYVFLMTYLLTTSRSQFSPSVSVFIDRCKLGVCIIVLDGILMSLVGG
jgi:hypothetical protein